MAIITIVGSGMMGSALAFPATDNGHTVRLVGSPLDRDIITEAKASGWHKTLQRKLPDGLEYYQIEELETALVSADLLICGVSSFGVDWFWQNVLNSISPSLPVLAVTKGMLNTPEGGFISFPQYYQNCLPDKKLILCAIGGPCTSYELADRHHSAVTFCGDDLAVLEQLRQLMGTSYYHISLSRDVTGVESAVALKNIYALAVTLAVGLAEKVKDGPPHYNTQAALFGQSIKETGRILELLAADSSNIYLAAGDLYVTIFGGRTRMIGSLLGQGQSFTKAMASLAGVTLESVVIAQRTAVFIREQIKQKKAKAIDFPLLLHIDDIISRGRPVKLPWQDFLR